MLITFAVKEQKITHDLGSKALIAGSNGIVQANFVFDTSWIGFEIVVVFSNSKKKCCTKPVRYSGVPINIPSEVLVAGKLYVSVIGFGDGERRKTTMKWDIQQAITVQECGAMGDCELLRTMTQEIITDDSLATDDEVEGMLDEVFKSQTNDNEPAVGDEDIASDNEVQDMLNEIFGS